MLFRSDAEFENRYAIRVTGLPSQTFMPETRAVPVVARLLTGASLEVSPQRHQQAWYVMRMAEKKSLVFAFPKDKLRLSLSTGYVWFNLKVNQMVIRVRFDLRTMRFRDLLAV